MKINDFVGKKIAILGFWKEWKSTLRFLSKNNISDVTILDKNIDHEADTGETLVISWDFYLSHLEEFDIIIKSAWISPYTNQELENYTGIITTATEIFFSLYSWKIIWITGTKGKSTTSSLCYHVLKSLWYSVALLGNIWNPSLDEYDNNYDYIIYELSSYMLEKHTPHLTVWVLINIFPDHLDWYDGSFENYREAKFNILRKAEKKIIHYWLSDIPNDINQEWIIYYNRRDKDINFHEWSFYIWTNPIFSHEGIHLEWEHNMENITCVLSILQTLSIDIHEIKNTLTNFCALPHRLEDFWVYSSIRFINDSISTTPESTIEAIKTYKENIGTIFLWWTDRWYSFSELWKYIKKYNIENIVLFPESGDKIKEKLSSHHNIIETTLMKEAVTFAFENTKKWKICILSTASPSYSLWKNFEEQGEDFKKNVKEISSQYTQ